MKTNLIIEFDSPEEAKTFVKDLYVGDDEVKWEQSWAGPGFEELAVWGMSVRIEPSEEAK